MFKKDVLKGEYSYTDKDSFFVWEENDILSLRLLLLDASLVPSRSIIKISTSKYHQEVINPPPSINRLYMNEFTQAHARRLMCE